MTNRNRDQDARYGSTFYNKRWGFVDTTFQLSRGYFGRLERMFLGRCPCGEVNVVERLKTVQIFHSQDMEFALVKMPASPIVTMKIWRPPQKKRKKLMNKVRT